VPRWPDPPVTSARLIAAPLFRAGVYVLHPQARPGLRIGVTVGAGIPRRRLHAQVIKINLQRRDLGFDPPGVTQQQIALLTRRLMPARG
jgi:hypothetical protein